VNHYTAAQVEAIIRSVFPADQADHAVAIAQRESSLVATAHNWCCFGLFQINFNANKSTLAAIGVTSAAQLYDPNVNVQAAYVLYERSGWAPWQ
jgi:Lysozyme like domain